MQSLTWTGRLISRALWNSLTNNKANDPSNTRTKKEPYLFSAVSGIPKDISNNKMFQLNKYGDDAYFTAKYRTADVLGKFLILHRIRNCGKCADISVY